MNIPIDVDAKLLIIPEKDVDEYDVMMLAEETCEMSLFSAVVGRHTAGVALRSDGVQGSAVRVRGDHLVEAKSSGDGVRDLGDVLGGEVDKGVFVLTSVGPGISSWQRRKSERAGERIGVQRGCGGVTGSGGWNWGRPGSLTRGANGPETGDERDDLVRSLGERTGRKQGMSGMSWGANGPETGDDLVRSLGKRTGRKSGVGSGVGGCIRSRVGAGARRVRWMIRIGIGIGILDKEENRLATLSVKTGNKFQRHL
ncbi:hypothetical protein GEV33_005668 [Tenebrio molitor]|uniref:Uncharacterized protein n=1 Tax=Tenebrio molitor TaxID=7067 RepID=A0A8J6HMT6_TENMO|nr:hypothetical protein GEV33_005668 [Tenebrio molitor]